MVTTPIGVSFIGFMNKRVWSLPIQDPSYRILDTGSMNTALLRGRARRLRPNSMCYDDRERYIDPDSNVYNGSKSIKGDGGFTCQTRAMNKVKGAIG